MTTITFVITLFVFVFHHAIALPDGSPVCTVGSAAPSSLHLTRSTIDTGPIAKRNFIVKIGSLTLDSTVNNTISATELSLELSSTTGTQFRGVLIILNKAGVDLKSKFVTSNPSLRAQDSCPTDGFSGITHTSRDFKSIADGKITLPANQHAFLDVNVVVANNSTNSEYYYTRFQLLGASNPAPTPVAAPIPASVPVPIPAKVPTKTPIKDPTKAPDKAPTNAPIRKPCGLFGLSIFCFNGCGLFGRLFGLCN